MAPTEPLIFVLHGARGDLAKRMVLPALATLQRRGLLPERWALLGTGRKAISSQEFDQLLHEAVQQFGDDEAAEGVPALTEHTAYCGDVSEDDSADELPGELERLRGVLGGDVTVIHYLAVPPSSFAPITRALAKAGLTDGVRIVYEKPYGTSPESFRDLDATVHAAFDEEQVFRIDHFLGKEATQNLHVLRFANELFGGIWSREHVEQVQIDVPETLDVDSARSSTTPPVPRSTCWSRTCSRWPPRWPWSRRDGSTPRSWAGRARPSSGYFRPLDPDAGRGPRTVRRLPRHRAGARRLHHRHVRRRAPVGGQRPVAGCAVPAADRQAHRRVRAAGHAGAADAGRALRLPRRTQPGGRVPDGLRPDQGHDDRQAARRVPRAGHRHGGPVAGRRGAGRPAAGVRGAPRGRARRRPDPVHHPDRAGVRVAAFEPLLGDDRPAPEPYAPGTWGPAAADRLAEPHGWVLGD